MKDNKEMVLKCWLGEMSNSILQELKKDSKIKIYGEYGFCKAEEREYFQETYGMIFADCAFGLFSLFREEVKDNLQALDLLDLDLAYGDAVKMNGYSLDLFQKDFDRWISKMRELFIADLERLLTNYQECEKNHYDFLKYAAQEQETNL